MSREPSFRVFNTATLALVIPGTAGIALGIVLTKQGLLWGGTGLLGLATVVTSLGLVVRPVEYHAVIWPGPTAPRKERVRLVRLLGMVLVVLVIASIGFELVPRYL